MQPQCSEEYFVIPTKTSLKIYKISDLSLKHTIEVKPTAFVLTNDFIIYSERGNLYYSSLLEDSISIEEIESFTSKITFISLNNKVLSLSTETGECLVYLFNFPEKKEISVITHIAPVKKIYSNGNTTFINDFRNKLKLFPTKKEYDNVENIFYHKYLFATEKKNLFCLNQNAFAVFLQCKEEIVNVVFSKNGSVVFIQSLKNLFVYDFNKEKLLKKISLEIKEENDSDSFSDDKLKFKRKNLLESSSESIEEAKIFYDFFIFNEKNNSVILIKETLFKVVNEATTVLGEKILNQKMKEVIFEKANYEENFVFLEEKDTNLKNKKSKKQNVILKTEFVKPNKEDLTFKNEHSSKLTVNNETNVKLENMFLEDSFENEVLSESEETVKLKEEKPILKVIAMNERLSLFDYDSYGYLTSLLGEEACFVNLICHDKEISPYKIIDRNLCKIGSFKEGRIVLANGIENKNKFYFHSLENSFENEIEDEILFVSLSDSFISLASKNVLTLFSYTNEEISSFYFENISFLRSKNDFIFVGEKNKLNIIDLKNDFSLKTFFLAGEFDWLDYWDNKIFYSFTRNGKKGIFLLKNGLSEKVCEIKSTPLIVKDDHVISLSKFDVEPFIEYNIVNYKIKKIPEEKILPSKENVEEIKNEPEFKREVIFKSKRFSPFKKQ